MHRNWAVYEEVDMQMVENSVNGEAEDVTSAA